MRPNTWRGKERKELEFFLFYIFFPSFQNIWLLLSFAKLKSHAKIEMTVSQTIISYRVGYCNIYCSTYRGNGDKANLSGELSHLFSEEKPKCVSYVRQD
jgi:hypothetical protein